MSSARLLRAYYASRRRRRQFWLLVNGCFDGLWLGLMGREALADLDEDRYNDGQDTLDGRTFTYADEQHNRRGLRDWESAVVDAHFPPGARVLVTGAGGGREVIALLEKGYDAIGYEPNPKLVAAGCTLMETLGHVDRLRVSERDAFPAGVGACDAVMVGWGSYMLMPGRARRIAFLRAARRALPDGAPLLCSFWVRDSGERYYAIVVRTANVVRALRRYERADLGDSVRKSYTHCFTRAEIAGELAAGGFRMISYAAEPYGHAVAVAAPPG